MTCLYTFLILLYVFIFSASLKVLSIFPVLHKARIDNMTDYIQRKMERISQGRQGNRRM